MTEAFSKQFTPFLLYFSKNVDLENVVLETIKKTFSTSNIDEILWINKEKANFSIEMVRNLTQEMSYGTYLGKVRHVVLVSIDQSSIEAQNALLKLLEEPPSNTQFWLTASHSSSLLPTIISRCQEINLIDRAVSETPSEIVQFFEQLTALSHREISEFAEKHSEREKAEALVENMILFAHQQMQSKTRNFASAIKELLQTKHYLEANVNVRLALEHCFFNLKKIVV